MLWEKEEREPTSKKDPSLICIEGCYLLLSRAHLSPMVHPYIHMFETDCSATSDRLISSQGG